MAEKRTMEDHGQGDKGSGGEPQASERIEISVTHNCAKKVLTENIQVVYPMGMREEFEIEGDSICVNCGFDYIDAVFEFFDSCEGGKCSL